MWFVLLFLQFRDCPFIGTFLPEASELSEPNRHLEGHLPSQFADECVQQKFRIALLAGDLLVIQIRRGVVETWACTAGALQTRPEWKPGAIHGRTMARLARGTPLSQHLTLCEDSELSATMLILCTFVFAVLLSLVEGSGVFEALGFDSRRRCRRHRHN